MQKIPFWVFVLIAILYFTAVRVDIMDIDASQYAEISREMLKSGDYLHIFDRGHDYLDKPPFLFWISALGMKIFGVNAVGYKVPSILIGLLGLYATYRLARLLYNETIGRMSALVLATSQGMFLWTNDVRCDMVLMSWTITGIWLVQEWLINRKLHHLLLGFAAISLGMMTKGPIALMVPVFCFGSDWVLNRQWRNFFHWQYLPALVVMALLLLPMSIGLYQQFDMHPEKLVDGKHGVSGLRFFYWSQSFGRITGESPWKNGADISFLLVNMLWSFLPWIFLFLPALYLNIAQLVRQKFRLQPGQEWISTGGFLLSYLALGSSAYQLPHYIFVAFPLASIITAKLLYDMSTGDKLAKLRRFMRTFQVTIISIILALVAVLITYIFPAHFLYVVLWVACAAIWIYLLRSAAYKKNILIFSAAGMIMANIFLTNQVYYTLLHYQVGSQLGRYIHAQQIPADQIISLKMQDPLNSLPFYAQEVIEKTDTLPEIAGKKYVLTMDKGIACLKQNHVPYNIERQGKLFKVSELTGPFIYPPTRNTELHNYYLLRMDKQ